jgi:hypothetical protein
MQEPRSIVAAIRALAKSGLGHEDIAVRLKLTPAEKAFARQIVLQKIADHKAEVA